MSRVISVMANENCRDSLTELLELPFDTFFQLEMQMYIALLRKEERAWNEYQMSKNR